MTEEFDLGIVGGGQLARMLVQAALLRGLRVCVLDPTPWCPAEQVGAYQIVGGLRDEAKLRELVRRSRVTTFEIEHCGSGFLSRLVREEGANIQPHPDTVSLVANKLLQHQKLAKLGIPTTPFRPVETQGDVARALGWYEGPVVLKTCTNGYDGRTCRMISRAADIKPAWESLGGTNLYVEAYVSFQYEIAVIVSRGLDGSLSVFPVVQTFQENGQCSVATLATNNLDRDVQRRAVDIAMHVVKYMLVGAGVFAIEMYVTRQGEILVNEIAPRVHNSGHLTIEACHTSQFNEHVACVLGLPRGNTVAKVPYAVMINILGRENGVYDPAEFEQVNQLPNTFAHHYGKAHRLGRKVGHITVTSNTRHVMALEGAEYARSLISL